MSVMKGAKFSAVCLIVGCGVGIGVEQIAKGYGALAGSVAAVSAALFFIHRWKDALWAQIFRNYYFIQEAAAMAVIYPKEEAPILPWSIWAVAPDALLRFVGMVRINGWTTVVEFGSGISTVVLAREFKLTGKGHVYALEHDAKWADFVWQMLSERGLTEYATVLTAPLAALSLDGRTFQWYAKESIQPALALGRIDALLVDGPKGDTCPLARYPALPTFLNQMGESSLVVLDDGKRPEEAQIAAMWSEMFGVKAALQDTSRGQWELFRAPWLKS
jgi:predicted O-methyltransferase YrrM